MSDQSQKRYAGRVGIFVVLGLIVVGALMLNFSRGVGMFKGKYDLKMRTRTVAGLKPRSAVFLAGVQIGNVTSIDLDQDTKTVIVNLRILEEFPLRSDAMFTIEQIGVLGDQFVTIKPGSADAPFLKNGDEVAGAEPFNFQELARSTTDLLKRFEQLGAVVGEAIHRVNTQVLDSNTLAHVSQTLGNFEKVSDRTLTVVDGLSVIVTNNAPALALSLSNLMSFTDRMQRLAGELDQTVASNRVGLNASMNNLQDATMSLKKISADVEAGKGTVGGLLRDDGLRLQLNQVVSNLAVLSSNLNRYGLLYKPKQPKNTKPPAYTGKDPTR
jgi:phospholipid/cholesterol/gamma-HCH transport system substrate-binding protein